MMSQYSHSAWGFCVKYLLVHVLKISTSNQVTGSNKSHIQSHRDCLWVRRFGCMMEVKVTPSKHNTSKCFHYYFDGNIKKKREDVCSQQVIHSLDFDRPFVLICLKQPAYFLSCTDFSCKLVSNKHTNCVCGIVSVFLFSSSCICLLMQQIHKVQRYMLKFSFKFGHFQLA